MLLISHRIFALLAFTTILTFWCSTVVVELFFSYEEVNIVKRLILFPGLFILVPALILTGISGNILAKGSAKKELIKKKKKRMPIIAIFGIFILIPCAIYLEHLSSIALYDVRYYVVQGLELLIGAVNIFLMGKNITDSIKASSLTSIN